MLIGSVVHIAMCIIHHTFSPKPVADVPAPNGSTDQGLDSDLNHADPEEVMDTSNASNSQTLPWPLGAGAGICSERSRCKC
jgi:hypothetical protein